MKNEPNIIRYSWRYTLCLMIPAIVVVTCGGFLLFKNHLAGGLMVVVGMLNIVVSVMTRYRPYGIIDGQHVRFVSLLTDKWQKVLTMDEVMLKMSKIKLIACSTDLLEQIKND